MPEGRCEEHRQDHICTAVLPAAGARAACVRAQLTSQDNLPRCTLGPRSVQNGSYPARYLARLFHNGLCVFSCCRGIELLLNLPKPHDSNHCGRPRHGHHSQTTSDRKPPSVDRRTQFLIASSSTSNTCDGGKRLGELQIYARSYSREHTAQFNRTVGTYHKRATRDGKLGQQNTPRTAWR